MADPIKSNLLSNTCGTPTSSNCVLWAGPNITGLGTCRGASITDVIFAMYQNCCGGDDNPCAARGWIDFSGSIPTSLVTATYKYTITAFGVGNSGIPSYKWTKEGNLALRGSLKIDIIPFISKEYFDIPLVTLDPTCFPANWKNNQAAVAFVDFFIVNGTVIPVRATAYVDRPTGILYLSITFADTILSPIPPCYIDLGAILFNLA